ncbi:MAG: DUF2190 family protein, partial [Sporomusaceae bacterium]|nr:DUF2190 family protein [Sporomusaceae bacterium]
MDYVQKGDTIDYTNSSGADIAYHAVIPLTSCIGIALEAIANGANGSVALKGVWSGTAVNNAVFAVGDTLYWDASAQKLTKVATGNTPAGICAAPKLLAGTIGYVEIGRSMITVDNAIEAGEVTSEYASAALGTHHLVYHVEDLDAGADITARKLLTVPTGCNYTLVSASITGKDDAAGIDGDNTAVITLTDGTNTIVTKTFDATTAFPAANTPTSLGALNATHKVLDAAESLTMTAVNGTAANLPPFDLEVV